MGGGVSIPVPVSATRQAELAKKYEAELSAGKDDAACAPLPWVAQDELAAMRASPSFEEPTVLHRKRRLDVARMLYHEVDDVEMHKQYHHGGRGDQQHVVEPS